MHLMVGSYSTSQTTAAREPGKMPLFPFPTSPSGRRTGDRGLGSQSPVSVYAMGHDNRCGPQPCFPSLPEPTSLLRCLLRVHSISWAPTQTWIDLGTRSYRARQAPCEQSSPDGHRGHLRRAAFTCFWQIIVTEGYQNWSVWHLSPGSYWQTFRICTIL